MKESGNTILITGGGSGIGTALGRRLAARGDTIVVAGRRREALGAAISGHGRMHAMNEFARREREAARG